MKTESPPGRRKFAGTRDKAEYLYHKLIYWLYEREVMARARVFADQLAQLLSESSCDQGAIFPEECWSLICEARGDMSGAIKHRENEVKLMKRLHEISRNSPQEKDILRLHGYEDLSDRLDLLASLYLDNDNLDKAIEILVESKKLCESHGIRFDGEDILRECHEEARLICLRQSPVAAPPQVP